MVDLIWDYHKLKVFTQIFNKSKVDIDGKWIKLKSEGALLVLIYIFHLFLVNEQLSSILFEYQCLKLTPKM